MLFGGDFAQSASSSRLHSYHLCCLLNADGHVAVTSANTVHASYSKLNSSARTRHILYPFWSRGCGNFHTRGGYRGVLTCSDLCKPTLSLHQRLSTHSLHGMFSYGPDVARYRQHTAFAIRLNRSPGGRSQNCNSFCFGSYTPRVRHSAVHKCPRCYQVSLLCPLNTSGA